MLGGSDECPSEEMRLLHRVLVNHPSISSVVLRFECIRFWLMAFSVRLLGERSSRCVGVHAGRLPSDQEVAERPGTGS